jgi:hypothetical protein
VAITCYICVGNNNFIHIEQACLLSQKEEVNPMNQQWSICQRGLEIPQGEHTCVPEVSASELPAANIRE